MRFPRSSGVLCHITCLPNEFGIGDLGDSSFRFVDFLHQAGQGIWQILPLSPPAHGNSPYSAYSAFAGNPLLISPRSLVETGLLNESDIAETPPTPTNPSRVDFDSVAAYRQPLLNKAFTNFLRDGHSELKSSFRSFVTNSAWWLDDFARYESLMRHFNLCDWTRWPRELAQRSEEAIREWDDKLANQIEFSKFQQFVFDVQWMRVKDYANQRGIRTYGDMPIFVAHESADVWANQDLFCLDGSGKPTLIAGVPPDYFSKTGQLWGNPQYRWDVIEATDYAWWTARFGQALHQFDLLRIDHFRGFESYWEVPAGSRTAVAGKWQQGPKEKPFMAARKKLGELPLIAEDLGMITEAVHRLRDRLGFPGMRVLQFGFEQKDDAYHRPSHYPEGSVAYTGTHDNDTVMGWYKDHLRDPDKRELLAEIITSDQEIHFQLVAAVLNSRSDTAVIPVQDLLGLGSEARMNQPGKAKGSWGWRLQSGAITNELAERLAAMTHSADRC
ncbi:4-alpha-glucanotransferase [Novipirellula artificiosorum]|uniref:4-alpha-glucanotransferase n=1 Tax=Novipirellula artificiosorum TaxID=2528016 RepID=A0A5C6DME5_9BACT|nr:4-alpha-glucanotransferase [Novipirellula artificiosorum]TWU37007.1 4-alpha-glucanotransferase [Novipirellula artificiosorum]